jgi:hypothetical protein
MTSFQVLSLDLINENFNRSKFIFKSLKHLIHFQLLLALDALSLSFFSLGLDLTVTIP